MGLSRAERLAGYRTVSRPNPHNVAILRRVARGTIVVTLGQDDDGKDRTYLTYEDGTIVRDIRGKPLSRQQLSVMVREGWLIPIKGGSLLGDEGPPQQYRARTPADPPLPRLRKL